MCDPCGKTSRLFAEIYLLSLKFTQCCQVPRVLKTPLKNKVGEHAPLGVTMA